MKVVLAGPGLMGSQIGCEFAIGGHEVVYLVNRREEAERRVAAAFDLAGTLGLWSDEVVVGGRDRVGYAERVTECDPATELFIESIVEERSAKFALLAAAAARLPNAILASNTSSIGITELGQGGGAPERTLGLHFWNPPLLMPLVEVISGPATDPAHVETVAGVVRGIGKRPMIVDRDVPGVVWNRLQLALLREAVWIVENGVAAPEVVDEIVQDGLARRWRYTGPFATAALGGPATFTKVAANLWPVLSTETELHDLAQWLRDSPEELAAIKARRDAGLLNDLKNDRAEGT
ncbi:MAG: 3-hydroxyacyl-CoA dehydrogenase family protein [Thermomicrobiales bacterium]|nr:3-hydroxyacyl-CoA dehydrogenase family protein [Thermomicrobiales bacterium]